ncbi:MAG: hypothetical protein ABI220_03870 [Candidatus Saccharimonadales bacterium]
MALTSVFKEGKPIKLWSAEVKGNAAYPDFERIVLATATRNKQRYTGYFETDDAGNVRSFTRTRYPRLKYGVTSIAECEKGMVELAYDLNFRVNSEGSQSGFRVVLGLLEGYDVTSPTHTVDEVQSLLGSTILAEGATVFAVRHQTTGVSIYTEPVAVLRGAMSSLVAVYDLADSLKQERFAVEDFGNRLSYMVETRYCTESD